MKLGLVEVALSSLKENHQLYHLYENYIFYKFTPCQGERNSQLVNMMTFLSRAVSKECALALAQAYYEVNQDVFADTLEQHMYEAESHLNASIKRWEDELSEDQKTLLEGLPPLQQEAYRICEDLALHECEQFPVGQFFLSCADLGKRLGTDMKNGHRILAQLVGMKVITILKKGTRHSKAGPGKATVYRWILGEEKAIEAS